MDERVFRAKCGRPIPQWDADHRLSINGNVSPEIRDNGTVFRINSTYMDVTDQPHMMRQWLAGGALVACIATVLCLYAVAIVLFLYPTPVHNTVEAFCVVLLLAFPLLFGWITLRLGRGEFFSLTRRPIRFNRVTKKIYAIRRRRWGHVILGDFFWEVPWNEKLVFCVHKGPAKFDLGEHYHVRCYQLDDDANVLRAFALGREWQGTDGMRDLLAQWNYWCEYMNRGPQNLPKPLLFLSEQEDFPDSFLYCLYEMGFDMGGVFRTIFMPFAVLLTTHRLMSMSTCRQPVWPDEVLDVSGFASSDPHDQPQGDTPVGWAATVRARRDGSYPRMPCAKTEAWIGDTDPMTNAQRWQADRLPT
jgi:hypothetical protein